MTVTIALGALLLLVCMCVCGARDDRLAEAWRAERERNDAAIGETPGGWRN